MLAIHEQLEALAYRSGRETKPGIVEHAHRRTGGFRLIVPAMTDTAGPDFILVAERIGGNYGTAACSDRQADKQADIEVQLGDGL